MRTLCILVLLQTCLFLAIDSTGGRGKRLEQLEQKVAEIGKQIEVIKFDMNEGQEYDKEQRGIDRRDLSTRIYNLEKKVDQLTKKLETLSAKSS